jgi:hypothetical protein
VITGILLEETNGIDKNADGTDKNILVFYADTDTDRKHRVVIATDVLDAFILYRLDQSLFQNLTFAVRALFACRST